MRTTSFLILAVALSAAAPVSAATGLSAAECEIWERERSFAESVARHDRAAFASHLHEGAVFGAASAQTQRGREAILAAWSPIIAGQRVTLEWRPQFVSLGAGVDVAMSRGPYALVSWDDAGHRQYAIGSFVSVWVRDGVGGPWRVLLDGGGPPPVPATEAEARAHLDAAPARCPRADQEPT